MCAKHHDLLEHFGLACTARTGARGAEIIELLVAQGADLSAKNNEGRTSADHEALLSATSLHLAEVLRRYGHAVARA